MAIKLYGPLLSNCAARVEMILLEKGVTDFEKVEVGMMRGAHKKPDYLVLQPFGKVPVLTDGDLTLFESRAICRYIAHKFEGQGTSLYGSSLKDVALIEQWMEVESHNCIPAVADLADEMVRKVLFTGSQPDKPKVAAATEQLGKVLDVYEAHLTGSKYLAGDFFSLADLSHLPTLMVLFNDYIQMGDLVNSRPHLRAWYEDISSRPLLKKLCARIVEETKAFQEGMKTTQ